MAATPSPTIWRMAGRAAPRTARGDMRAAQIAGIIAGYIRRLGWNARAHIEGASDVWREALIVRAGLGDWRDGKVVNPFLGGDFRAAVVTTDMPIAHDQPLDPKRNRLLDKGAAFWLGTNGAYPEMERRREKRRLSHLGRHPMERIKRVDQPTTLILEDEVPRVPKRAAWFERAFRGDIGDKAKRERTRFAMKHPFANAMGPIMRSMVPHQDGQIAPTKAAGTDDPGPERARHQVALLLPQRRHGRRLPGQAVRLVLARRRRRSA